MPMSTSSATTHPVQRRVMADGAEVLFVRADVSDVASAQASAAAAIERFGRIDGLVNAAGEVSRGTLLDTTPELFDRHIAVNSAWLAAALIAAVLLSWLRLIALDGDLAKAQSQRLCRSCTPPGNWSAVAAGGG